MNLGKEKVRANRLERDRDRISSQAIDLSSEGRTTQK